MRCTEWFERIEKWWSQYAVEPALEETGSLLVDMSPVLAYLCWEMKTYYSLSATPDASQMKHGLECVRCGEVEVVKVGSVQQDKRTN